MSQDLIEIRGKTANSFVEYGQMREKQTTCAISKLVQAIRKDAIATTPILPTGTKLFLQQGNKVALAVEEPPRVRTLAIVDGSKTQEYRLAFPFTVFVLSASIEDEEKIGYLGGFLLYRNSPLTSQNDQLWLPNLPHINSNGQICIGAGDQMTITGTGLGRTAEQFVQKFWASNFNTRNVWQDLWNINKNLDERVGSPGAWQKATQKDPLFVLKISWRKANYQVGALLQRSIGNRDQWLTCATQIADLMQKIPAKEA